MEKLERNNETVHQTNQDLQNLQNDVRNNNNQQVLQDYVHRPEFQQLSDSAKIHKNAREYLSKHESLSEAQYNQLFS
jgi:hypothetical protein